jgi:hypothetical protein
MTTRRKAYKPIAVGSLIRRRIGFPADALSPILQLLIAKEPPDTFAAALNFRRPARSGKRPLRLPSGPGKNFGVGGFISERGALC